MLYENEHEVDANFRVIKCPKCSNEDFSEEANYCKICGAPLFNTCEDQHTCYHNNVGNARFCETCGSQTEFFKLGYLNSWEESTENPFLDSFVPDKNSDDNIPF